MHRSGNATVVPRNARRGFREPGLRALGLCPRVDEDGPDAATRPFEAEAYRRNIFGQLDEGVLLVDRTQRIIDANPHALAALGYCRTELLALRIADVVADFERKGVAPEAAAVMNGDRHFAAWMALRKDGTQFPVEVSARVLDPERFVVVARDISIQRESEAAASRAQVELAELSRRLLSQESTTMRRIAQSLHDHLGQTLVAARLNLDAFMLAQAAALPAEQREQGLRIARLLDQAVGEVRRVLADLRPPLLEAQGLAQALFNEVDSLVVTSRLVDVLVEIDDGITGLRWSSDVEYSAFMVAREAVVNAQQHAGASLVRVLLQGSPTSLDLQIVDDGVGIPAPMVLGRPGHLGIVGMRERATAVGACFSIERHEGGGTTVSFRWTAKTP